MKAAKTTRHAPVGLALVAAIFGVGAGAIAAPAPDPVSHGFAAPAGAGAPELMLSHEEKTGASDAPAPARPLTS